MNYLYVIIIALILNVIFKIQYSKGQYYFGIGELVYGITTSISLKSIVAKLLIVILYTWICLHLIHDSQVVIAGIMFGSIMLVWPGIINQDAIKGYIPEMRWVANAWYILLVIIIWLIANICLIVFNHPVIAIINGINLINLIKKFIFLIFTIFITEILRDVLNKHLHIPLNHNLNYKLLSNIAPIEIQKELSRFNITNENLVDNWGNLHYIMFPQFKPPNKEHIEHYLMENQDIIFENRPVLGAQKWYITDLITLSDDYIAVKMEDGHIMNAAILKYNSKTDNYNVVMEALS